MDRESPTPWLIRIPSVFQPLRAEILESLGAGLIKPLGRDYTLARLAEPELLQEPPLAKFAAWKLPVEHMWPCQPHETPGFVEKAAQTLWRKFGGRQPQALLVGVLNPAHGNRHDRALASNLRGRTLQLFPPEVGRIRMAEEQDSRKESLFCLLGAEGLFCGMHSPLAANGFHPGGTKFVRQSAAISRAGAKLAEALHYLALHRPVPPAGSHWLELGASPGGMTAELLARGYRVTAIDRAPLDPRLAGAALLDEKLMDASLYQPHPRERYDAMLCDMNGDARASLTQVLRLCPHLQAGGLVIFTLKLAGAEDFAHVNELERELVTRAGDAGMSCLERRHLTYNRWEFTLFFERRPH